MLIFQNHHLQQVATGSMAVHQLIAGLAARPEVNAISVSEYLLARDHAITPDRQALDAWLIARLTRAVVSCQQVQSTATGKHAQQIVKRWLASFAESQAVGDVIRAAARG